MSVCPGFLVSRWVLVRFLGGSAIFWRHLKQYGHLAIAAVGGVSIVAVCLAPFASVLCSRPKQDCTVPWSKNSVNYEKCDCALYPRLLPVPKAIPVASPVKNSLFVLAISQSRHITYEPKGSPGCRPKGGWFLGYSLEIDRKYSKILTGVSERERERERMRFNAKVLSV